MKIWLITIGEPLPFDEKEERLYRTGLLAQHLSQNHEVIWWSSSFNHHKKSKRVPQENIGKVNPFLKIELLNGMSYASNLSLKRIINHIQLVWDFQSKIKNYEKPDVILCSYPTIGLSDAAVRFARAHQIPIAIDIRDLWPEAIVNLFPRFLKPFIKALLWWNFHQSRFIFRQASSLIGISEKYLEYGLKKSRRKQNPHRDRVFPLGYPNSELTKPLDLSENFLTSLNIDKNKFICWFIGYFGRTYDLTPIITAAKILQQNGNLDIQFLLSGTGDKYHYWMEQAKGCDNIIFTGWVDKQQIQTLGRIAKLGLQAYANEAPQGLANKLFEYLSFGLPVLSSLKGENEALVNQFEIGFNFDTLNPQSFLEKLNILYTNPDLLDKMSQNARNLFLNQFDNAVINKNLEQHLTALVKNKS